MEHQHGTPGTSNPRDNALARLLTGLRISDQELVQLLTNLAAPLGITLTGPASAHAFAVSIGNLSLLYRHATLARVLGLSILQLFQLITAANVPVDLLAPPPIQPTPPAAPTVVHVIDTLAALLDARDWTSASSFSGDEMAFVTGRIPLDASLLPDAPTIATATVAQLQSDHAFEFADTILSGLPNGTSTLTEAQSRTIVALNSMLFEPAADGSKLRLKASIVPEPTAASILLPNDPEITVSKGDVAARLAKSSIHQLVKAALANAVGLARDKADALCRLSGQAATLDAGPFLQAMAALLYAPGTDQTALINVLKSVLPLDLLYRDDVYDAATLDFIGQSTQTRTAFGLAGAPDSTSVRLSARFRDLAKRPIRRTAPRARPRTWSHCAASWHSRRTPERVVRRHCARPAHRSAAR